MRITTNASASSNDGAGTIRIGTSLTIRDPKSLTVVTHADMYRISNKHGSIELCSADLNDILWVQSGSEVKIEFLSEKQAKFVESQVETCMRASTTQSSKKPTPVAVGALLYTDGLHFKIRDDDGLEITESVTCWQVRNKLGILEVRKSVLNTFNSNYYTARFTFKTMGALQNVRTAALLLCDQSVQSRDDTEIKMNGDQILEDTCPECYDTGFRHGFGAPCSKGCGA